MMNAIFLLLALFLAGCSPEQARTTEPSPSTAPPQHLRVGTWNLLNLFDNVDHPDGPDEGTDPKSFFELQAVAEAIDALDVDVLGVQEVENREILEVVNAHLRRPFAHVELIEGNDHRGIDVGLLSRVPVISAKSHRTMDLGGEHKFARDFPLFRLQATPETAIDFGVVHLKSKRGPAAASDAWRRAEAEGIASVLSDTARGEVPFVVMGDFNDLRDARTLEPVFALGRDCTESVPLLDRYSYVYRGRPQQIDHVLASRSLKIAGVKMLHPENSASDHHPIVVEFDLGAPVTRDATPAGRSWSQPSRPELRADDLATAARHLLKEIVITGAVMKVHRGSGGSTATLNFHESYKQAVTAYIPREAIHRFGDVGALVGKTVSVAGPVIRRTNGVFQIRLTRRKQLSIR